MFGFGGGKDYENPADSAMPYLEEIPGVAHEGYDPYVNFGQASARVAAPVYYKRITDPTGAYNDIMDGYEQSDQYLWDQEQLTKQQQADAAAGGYTGTYYDQQKQADTTQGLMSRDEQRYFNNVEGMQDSGLGAATHAFDTGFQASTALTDMLANNYAAEAGLQYQGTAFENEMEAQHANNLWNFGGQALGGTLGFMGLNSGKSNNYYQDPYISGYSPHY